MKISYKRISMAETTQLVAHSSLNHARFRAALSAGEPLPQRAQCC